ncbi:MAG TPA: HEAT repeat domain-containing protein, partial [Opitutales bacterium]|nr:HEAT repeat domain-containing protein [Opitutales bacterium]
MPTADAPRAPKNTRWLAAALFVGLLVLGWIIYRTAHSPVEKSAETPAAANVPSRKAGAAPAYDLHAGDQLIYTFNSSGTLTMGSTDPAGGTSTLKVTEAGRFHVNIYAATATGWLAGFAWEEVKLTLESGQGEQSLTPPDLAGTEVLVTLEKNGRIADVRVPLSLSANARNNWRDTLSKWQVILPDNAASTKWTRVEEDATGTFIAQYSLAAAPSQAVAKNKTHYLRINGANAGLAAIYLVAGSEQIQFDGFPRSGSGTEKIDFGGAQGMPQAGSTGDYAFTLMSTTYQGAKSTPDTAKYTSMGWAAEFGAAILPMENDGDFATNVSDLRRLIDAGGFNSPDEIRTGAKIIDLVKKNPDLADRLLDELRGNNVSGPLAAALLGILGAAGTAPAQYDLLAVADSGDLPMAVRQMALFAYVQVTDPVPEADAALKAMFEADSDLSGSALLVLAAMGDKVRASDPARFQQINDYVVKVLNTPNLPLDAFVVALDAIGNLGPAQVPPVVAEAALSDNPLIRAKAITSLARIPTDQALSLVNHAIESDPADTVQVAGVKTLVTLEKSGAVDNLAKIAANGKSTAARKEALTQLANFADSNKNVAGVLEAAAKNDPADEVRDYANKLLGNLTAPAPA